jgi:hypothetical protein
MTALRADSVADSVVMTVMTLSAPLRRRARMTMHPT